MPYAIGQDTRVSADLPRSLRRPGFHDDLITPERERLFGMKAVA